MVAFPLFGSTEPFKVAVVLPTDDAEFVVAVGAVAAAPAVKL